MEISEIEIIEIYQIVDISEKGDVTWKIYKTKTHINWDPDMIFHHYFWASNWLIEWQIWSLKITLGFCFDIQSLCSEICLLDLLSLVILLSGDNLLLLHFENLLRKLKSGNKWSGIQNLQLKLYSQTFVHILSFNQRTPTTFQISRIS